MLFSTLLKKHVRSGSMRLIDGRGREHLVGEGAEPRCTVRLANRRLDYSLALRPTLSIGEAYMDGRLVVEDGTLYDLMDILLSNYHHFEATALRALIGSALRGMSQHNPIGKARRNVAHHYDLSGELYRLFLDADRQYSCAYFTEPGESLETAQENKKRHIAAKLLLDRPGLSVLDIGSGWGGLGLYLAAETEARVTGVTLSTEQQKESTLRAAKMGLAERVQFHLRDYREQTGPYDRIVSVGMFEHVGKRNYREFFQKLRDLLADDGVALLHSIGFSDIPAPINPFIRKYIFPGADLPSLSEVLAVVETTGLIVTDIEILRLHYADTLREWRHRFAANWDRVAAIYDERFCRMWEFYLVLCELGFRRRSMMVFQMQLAKRLDAVPLTRDYIADWEQNHRRPAGEMRSIAS